MNKEEKQALLKNNPKELVSARLRIIILSVLAFLTTLFAHLFDPNIFPIYRTVICSGFFYFVLWKLILLSVYLLSKFPSKENEKVFDKRTLKIRNLFFEFLFYGIPVLLGALSGGATGILWWFLGGASTTSLGVAVLGGTKVGAIIIVVIMSGGGLLT